jgi:hypothetical protein
LDFNPYDVSMKKLVWDGPVACLERFGIGPPGPVEVIDSDITTLTAAADKVIKVGGPEPYLVNIEFQSYHDIDVTRTLWFRQTALDYRHDLPVLTVLVLLRIKGERAGPRWQLRTARTERPANQLVRFRCRAALGGRPRLIPKRRCRVGAPSTPEQRVGRRLARAGATDGGMDQQ